MVAHAYNPNTQDTEAWRSLVEGQPGLNSEFQAILGCIRRLCLKETTLQI
jgi:hypothetical protein